MHTLYNIADKVCIVSKEDGSLICGDIIGIHIDRLSNISYLVKGEDGHQYNELENNIDIDKNKAIDKKVLELTKEIEKRNNEIAELEAKKE